MSPFFPQTDGRIWPIVAGVLLVLILTMLPGVPDALVAFRVAIILGFATLFFWLRDLIWLKTK